MDAAILFVTIFYTSYAFGMVFMICELGQRMSNAFEEIEGVIVQFNWYLFPDKLKQMLPIILMNAQDQVAFECFGSIICSREAFRKVSSKYEKVQILWTNISLKRIICF